MPCVFFSLVRLVRFVRLLDSQINAILTANPLNCPWRKHSAAWLHAILRELRLILFEPAPECCPAHACCIGKFVFICTFHSFSYLLQSYGIFLIYARFFATIFRIMFNIVSCCFTSFHIVSTPFPNVVPLHRERKEAPCSPL